MYVDKKMNTLSFVSLQAGFIVINTNDINKLNIEKQFKIPEQLTSFSVAHINTEFALVTGTKIT